VAFNRPDLTKRVFEEIRKSKPKKLFVSVDGPRNDLEKEKVNEVIKIVSNVDWSCSVKKKFNKKNLGCREAEISAMTWFFENVEEGIVLEDDCLPSPAFFRFCEEMLKKYRNDERIMHISGNNFLGSTKKETDSYYFSKYPFSWGWASWKRAWKFYDPNMKLYPEFRKRKHLNQIYTSVLERESVKRMFEATYKGLDTWDYQWHFSILANSGLAIIPNKNLVQNIGFRDDSTHTKKLDAYLSTPRENLNFPLNHPSFLIWDKEKDKIYFKRFFLKRVKNFFIRKLGLNKIFKVYE
jgi:hypothetical protein